MNSLTRNFLLSMIILPLFGLTTYAADAPEVNYPEIDNFYMGLSVNVLSGDSTQDDGGNWTDYTDTPIWYDESNSFGLNFGMYLNTTSKSRLALEVNYISQLKSEDFLVTSSEPQDTLVNEYNDIMTLEYLYLHNIYNNAEIFGSAGVGRMTISGGQFDNTLDDRASESESFFTYGGGVLFNLADNYDFKFAIKYLPDFETEELDLVRFTDRTLGLEDAYITTASLQYNF